MKLRYPKLYIAWPTIHYNLSFPGTGSKFHKYLFTWFPRLYASRYIRQQNWDLKPFQYGATCVPRGTKTDFMDAHLDLLLTGVKQYVKRTPAGYDQLDIASLFADYQKQIKMTAAEAENARQDEAAVTLQWMLGIVAAEGVTVAKDHTIESLTRRMCADIKQNESFAEGLRLQLKDSNAYLAGTNKALDELRGVVNVCYEAMYSGILLQPTNPMLTPTEQISEVARAFGIFYRELDEARRVLRSMEGTKEKGRGSKRK